MAFGSHGMPVCARCEGLYLGFLIVILIGWVTGRKEVKTGGGWAVCALSALFAAALIVDAAASGIGLWDSGNRARLLLGLLGGGGIAVFIGSLFRWTFIDKTAPWKSVTATPGFLFAIAAMAGAWSLHFSDSALPFHVLSFGAVAGVLLYYLLFNLAIAGTLMDWRKRNAGLKDFLILAGAVGALLGVELFTNTWLHRI